MTSEGVPVYLPLDVSAPMDLVNDYSGMPVNAFGVVDLDEAAGLAPLELEAFTAAVLQSHRVLIGVSELPISQQPLATSVLREALVLALVPRETSDSADPADPADSGTDTAGSWPRADHRDVLDRTCVEVPDVSATMTSLSAAVSRAPLAATVLPRLLRLTSNASVEDGLTAESLAYSTLLAGPEFRSWREATPVRPAPSYDAAPVILDRRDGVLRIAFNRPERHNAFADEVRDALVDALAVAEADRTIERVDLTGVGASFCSGVDLDELGTKLGVAQAHVLRTSRSAGAAIHRLGTRVHAHLHGAAIGAGIEVPAFAGYVSARPDSLIQLPQLTFGLVPGAGGTVSVTHRIGRWRTAYLILSGERIDVRTALGWGLVDAVE